MNPTVWKRSPTESWPGVPIAARGVPSLSSAGVFHRRAEGGGSFRPEALEAVEVPVRTGRFVSLLHGGGGRSARQPEKQKAAPRERERLRSPTALTGPLHSPACGGAEANDVLLLQAGRGLRKLTLTLVLSVPYCRHSVAMNTAGCC